jgi:hypothetical protein
MEEPRPKDLAHDLRNLVGLVRALSAELIGLLAEPPEEVAPVARELDAYSRYAIDALRVVEKWHEPTAVEVHLGAWAWALRLGVRELVVGELVSAGRATVVVPRALAAGRDLVLAMGGGRAVRVEPEEGGAVRFEIVGSAADASALDLALGALRAAGLHPEVVHAAPCTVLVRG